MARQSQAVIYAIGLADPYEEENPNVLRKLCKDTGGIAYFPDSRENVTDISKQIARDLRGQYALGFAPDKTSIDRSYKNIEVKVAASGRGKIRVRTRNGYFGSDEKSSATPYDTHDPRDLHGKNHHESSRFRDEETLGKS